MKRHPWQDRLSEYLDGELTPSEVSRCEEHLSGCEECRQTLGELNAVIAQAGGLPLPTPPSTLWDGIASRMASRPAVAAQPKLAPHRRSISPRWAIAAGLVIAALSGGGGWLLRGPQGEETLSDNTNSADPSMTVPVRTDNLPPEIAAALADYAESVAKLEVALERVADRMDPESYESIQGNLYTIDSAIFEARSALSADPESEYLNAHLANSMVRKIRLLQQATRLASNEI